MRLSNRLRWIRRGFLPKSFLLYDLTHTNYRRYLSDRDWERTYTINGAAMSVLSDKVLFTFLAASHGIPVPPVRAILGKGALRWLGPPLESIDQQSVRRRLAERPLVVKPVTGHGGRDVYLLTSVQDEFLLNDEHIDWPALERFLEGLDYYLVTDHVQQAAYSAQMFPHTANTIRALTAPRRGSAEPTITAAAHRIGTSRSRPVDNWVQGGIGADIDLRTGELSSAAGRAADGRPVWHRSHPETGVRIEGVQVPGWEATRRLLIDAAQAFSFLPYIAWDVVITDNAGAVVIEANPLTSVDVFQVHAPLLDNPDLRAFYEQHGVLRHSRTEPTLRRGERPRGSSRETSAGTPG
jgi:hypothetical protein